jgi:hypothetical protein
VPIRHRPRYFADFGFRRLPNGPWIASGAQGKAWQMNVATLSGLAGPALFAATVGALLIGRSVGRQRLVRDPASVGDGQGPIDAAVFGLFGLLLDFTFSGAGARLDERRALIAVEANAIGTAWLRFDLRPDDSKPALRQMFRDWPRPPGMPIRQADL